MASEDRFESLTKEHQQQWAGFATLLQWGTGLSILTVVLLAAFVA